MNDDTQIEQINRLIFQFHRQHFTRVFTLMEEIGIYKGQPPILNLLIDHDGCTQKEMSELLQLAPATVTKTLQRMECSGFVERRTDSQDQRSTRVYLTSSGRATLQQVKKREQKIAEEVLVGFEPEERESLIDYLTRMRDNLTKVNRGHTPWGS